jgi:hypothetical protein
MEWIVITFVSNNLNYPKSSLTIIDKAATCRNKGQVEDNLQTGAQKENEPCTDPLVFYL